VSATKALGRIIETHPGANGIIRTVIIKTATGELKRLAKCYISTSYSTVTSHEHSRSRKQFVK